MEENRPKITEEATETQNFEIVDAGVTLQSTMELYRYIYRAPVRLLFIIAVLLFVTAVILSLVQMGIIWPLCIASIVSAVIGFAFIQAAKNIARKSYEHGMSKKEVFHVYGDHLEYRVSSGDALEFLLRIPVEKIKDIAVLKDIYAFKYEGVVVSIPKMCATEGSALFRILFPDGVVEDTRKKEETMKTAYITLTFVASLYMLVTVFVVGAHPSLWWLPILGLPIPVLAFVVFGIAHSKGIKIPFGWAANILLACLTVFFLLYSPLQLALNALESWDTYMEDMLEEQPSLDLLAACDIQLSSVGDVYSRTYKTFDAYSNHYVEVANTEISLTEQETYAFCDVVDKEERWVTTLEGETREFFLTYVDYYAGDVFFVYNLTEETYNALPTGEGECDYLVVIFSSRYNYIDIYEFTK